MNNIPRRYFLQGLSLASAGLLVPAACTTSRGLAASTGDSLSDTAIRDAFLFAYPIYEFARVARVNTKSVEKRPGQFNTIRRRARLQDHTNRTVTGPNNDTIYTSTFLELSGGPIELRVPTEKSRYFSIAFMNILTDNFAYIGTRATNGEGGRFWLVGPSWQGQAPADTTLIRCDSNDVWMLSRTLVNGPSDLENAKKFHEQITLVIPPDRPAARPFVNGVDEEISAQNFLAVVNEMLARSPSARGELERVENFRGQGLLAPEIIDARLLQRWDKVIPDVMAGMRRRFRQRRHVVDGWAYQGEGIGDFGKDDRKRATVALGGLAALGEEEAMYFHANSDSQNRELNGANRYRFVIPPEGIPAKAFWSLTMYEVFPDGRHFLAENPIGRYSIGDRTDGLLRQSDGSIEIIIQHDPPADEKMANWLPAPMAPFKLSLRAYVPGPEILERRWTVPPLRRVD